MRQKPSLEQADAWLAQTLSRKAVGIEALLESSGMALVVEALAQKGGSLAASVTTEEDAAALGRYLHKLAGMDAEWLSFAPSEPRSTPLERVLTALSTWLLSVEYVHDLRRDPHLPALKRLKGLAKPLVATCTELASRLRQGHPDAYVQLADDAEAMLDIELEAMKPEDLGQIDTFREEENQVLRGAVGALKAQEWAKAAEWARAREGEKSFWLGRDPERRRAWNLVAEAAAFGTVLTLHPRPFEKLHDFEDALTRYQESASLVDRAHRHFEQEWLRRLDTQTPHYGALQEVLGALRLLHRAWADALSKDFARLCKALGFLPPLHLQQRTLYEQVVEPLAHGGERVAIFLVDALRYEMATELVDDLKALAGGAVVDLKARFAELPTVTAVGMNALAPTARAGRLQVAGAFKGFRSGETLVATRADRAKAMGTRTSGKAAVCLTLANVCGSTPEALKNKLKEHQVAVVCSSELDDAGESGVGLLTFEAQLRQLKAAWHHLQTAGFKHALFTADHGFLLQDSTTKVRASG